MQHTTNFGLPIGEDVGGVFTLKPWDFASLALLKAEKSADLSSGRVERVRALHSRAFYWHPTSLLTADDQLVVRPTDVAVSAAGRWLAVPGQIVDLEGDFTFATADNATLYSMPTGANLLLMPAYWEVTTGFTGGTSSAIGLDSDQSGLSTAGDILGGSGGDVAATLVAGDYITGTIGAQIASGKILRAGSAVRLQRITSAFTAGAGKAHVVGALLTNLGA